MIFTISLRLKFWKLLNNSKATFNLENVNLPSNPSANPQNGVAYIKKDVIKVPVLKQGRDLRLKVHNMSFSGHITFKILIL